MSVLPRQIVQIVWGQALEDGAGVVLTRLIGPPPLAMLDPFLMLDAFGSDRPDDYIGGFPAHPHRGFETVTYLLSGRMRHRDSAGHAGVIEACGVQWMTAGRGIVHSEMPEIKDGLLQGFQLWVNLPAAAKWVAPAYQEFKAEQIPVETRVGATVTVIAGTTARGLRGAVYQPLTDPRYFDIRLAPGALFEEAIPDGYNAFVYVIAGAVQVADGLTLATRELGVLTQHGPVRLMAGSEMARLLLVSGRPLGEPVARGGPFVMNSEAEVRQAFDDYRAGRLGTIP